jgi:hypothetical protein
MAERNHRKDSCPFWSPSTLSCSLCSGGLFIPLDEDHIEIYCKSTEFPHCLQYNLNRESILRSRSEAIANENRRKHARVKCSHSITLAWLSDSGKIASHTSIEAAAIDMSMGGLRLRSLSPLSNDTVVRFSFDDPIPGLPQSGTASIKWCHRLIDRDEYQSGLAFRSNHTVEAMGKYLGQP